MSNLEAMLNKQREFQMRMDPKFLDMSVKERVAFIKEHSIHLNQEVNEMLYELPYFKPWKDYSGVSPEAEDIALAKARMECIDAWHFFMNIMLALGFTADEFVYMYMEKNKENHRRQDDGYTADKSYKDQAVEDVLKDRCTVTSDGKTHNYGNFIVMGVDDNGVAGVIVNTDLLNMGVTANILQAMYSDAVAELSDNDRALLEEDVAKVFNGWVKNNEEN